MAIETNNAENKIDAAFINDLKQLRRDFDDFRTTPQKIGNGSINYATFSTFAAGPITIGAGVTTIYSLTYMPTFVTFTYAGLPAINRASLFDLYYSVSVDVNDANHVAPYGSSLTSGQLNYQTSYQYDYYSSGLAETSGQVWVNIFVTNKDTVSHSYYLAGTALIPRPALKPQ